MAINFFMASTGAMGYPSMGTRCEVFVAASCQSFFPWFESQAGIYITCLLIISDHKFGPKALDGLESWGNRNSKKIKNKQITWAYLLALIYMKYQLKLNVVILQDLDTSVSVSSQHHYLSTRVKISQDLLPDLVTILCFQSSNDGFWMPCLACTDAIGLNRNNFESRDFLITRTLEH